jgi:hypothetical protein
VTKLNASGTGLIYSTYLDGNTGSYNDGVYGIAVDTAGNAYVSGNTSASDFPTTVGAFQSASPGGGQKPFVAKLNAAGSGLIYSTYVSGSSGDTWGIGGIAIDSSGNAYTTGWTDGSSFPTTAGALQTALAGGTDVFVSKLNPTGTALVFSTYLGGSGSDQTPPYGGGIAVDGSSNVFVTGLTNSTDFPNVNSVQSGYGGATDAFATKLNASGVSIDYSTYLGGSGSENSPFTLGVIAADAAGNAYVTGNTSSTDFPTVNPAQATNGGGADAFVAKITDVTSVTIDIKPGGGTDPINLASNGVIPLALYGSAGFDVTQVDVSSVVFAGAHAAHYALQDINGDGYQDMILQFRTQDTNLKSVYAALLSAADTDDNGHLDSNVSTRQTASLSLTGTTVGGKTFAGSDDADLFLAGKSLQDFLATLGGI